MKEFKKAKKKYNISAVLLLILAIIVIVAGISLDFLAEIDNVVTTTLFIVALVLVVLTIPFIFFIARFQSKLAKNIVAKLNKTLEGDCSYQEGAPILDIIDDSMHPYNKDTNAISKDGIVGKYEDISFEYYLCAFQQESLFLSDSKNTFELYVFKNVSVFPKEFFVTAKKMKNVDDFQIIPTKGLASIYTRKKDEVILEDLPKDVSFLSVNQNTLYVYKFTEQKKPLFQVAESIDQFKDLFNKQLEKIKHTYDETKAWI